MTIYLSHREELTLKTGYVRNFVMHFTIENKIFCIQYKQVAWVLHFIYGNNPKITYSQLRSKVIIKDMLQK